MAKDHLLIDEKGSLMIQCQKMDNDSMNTIDRVVSYLVKDLPKRIYIWPKDSNDTLYSQRMDA